MENDLSFLGCTSRLVFEEEELGQLGAMKFAEPFCIDSKNKER